MDEEKVGRDAGEGEKGPEDAVTAGTGPRAVATRANLVKGCANAWIDSTNAWRGSSNVSIGSRDGKNLRHGPVS